MNTKKQKIGVGVLIGVVLVVGGWGWWSHYGPYDITTPESEIGSLNEYNRFMNSLEEAWANDYVGFGTPEETFDAFREALKAGDYELAASYFVPEKQEEMFRAFEQDEDKYVGFLVEDLYLDNTRYQVTEELVRFRTVKDSEGHTFTYDVRLNPINNIWKMYEL